MKAKSFESVELLMMTVLCVIASIVAVVINHPRTEQMIALTIFLALMAFIARYRQHRHYRTLRATARRKRRVTRQ